LLEKADAVRPEHYAIIQNLGIVLLDPRFDPEGHRLKAAERYFAQSIELKENDYFGHEQLAMAKKREIARQGAGSGLLKSINEGLEQAKRAVALRPRTGGAFITLSELSTMTWLLEGIADADKEKQYRHQIEHALDRARELYGEMHPRFCWADLAWNAAQFKTNEHTDFAASRQSLLSEIEIVLKVADRSKIPDAWDVKRSVERLKTAVEAATSKTYKKIVIFS